jgi:hypothetical protein
VTLRAPLCAGAETSAPGLRSRGTELVPIACRHLSPGPRCRIARINGGGFRSRTGASGPKRHLGPEKRKLGACQAR